MALSTYCNNFTQSEQLIINEYLFVEVAILNKKYPHKVSRVAAQYQDVRFHQFWQV